MAKADKIINALIIESSVIIRKGMYKLLEDSFQDIKIEISESLSEKVMNQSKGDFDIVIINPSIIQNNMKEFNSIKIMFDSAVWVGLIYSFYSKELLNQFDKLIYVNDTLETIKSTISRINESSENFMLNHKKEHLTGREIDVLKSLAEGNSNKEIAYKLNISTHTVVSHRKNISQKTGIRTVSGLTIYAVINNIITI
jgi:DNA-binding NarL/FixJ family response regulator